MTENTDSRSATQHLVQGSIWMIAARWAMRLIGLVSTVILARLLAPSDFGVIAIALIFTGLFETIAYAGVDLALMRPGMGTDEHYNTAWTIQLIQGALISLSLLLIAPFASPFFSEPRATAVLQALAIRPIIAGLQNVGIVNFRKEMDFSRDFRFSLYTKLLNFGVLVGSAFWFRSYWALVIGMTSSCAIDVILSYVMHPYRPRLCLSKAREIWGFSIWLILARVGSFLNRKTDEFVVGRLLGTTRMGGYHVANELATMPTTELVMPLRRAMFPTLAKVAGQADEFEKLFLLSFSALAIMGVSVGFGLMAVAPELVPLVLGDKWLSAVDAMRWLALYGTSSSLILTLEMALWVSGRTRLSAIQTWTELAALIPVAYFAATAYGAEGAAMARLGVSAATLPLTLYFVSGACSIPMSRLYSVLWRPLVAGLGMALVLRFAAPGADFPVGLILAAKVMEGILVFPSLLIGLWLLSGRPAGIETKAAEIILARLQKRVPDNQ